MSANINEISYTDAMAEIERILAELRSENVDVDTLAAKVARATELIDICKKRLHTTAEEVRKLLDEQ